MSLRRKLLLGFGGLLAVIAVVGFHAAARISELGLSIDVILRENYRSVIACQDMKEAIGRMDDGAVLALLGRHEEGRAQAERNERLFLDALRVEEGNITLPGEGERAARVRERFERYRSGIRPLFDPRLDPALGRALYHDSLVPLLREIQAGVDSILRMNQENMAAMDARARRRAATARRQTYLILSAVTLVTALFLYGTGRWILRPIRRLTESADEIRRGNLDLVIPGDSRDEIGRLTASFNEMAASLREFRRSGQARELRIRRSVQQAFDSLPEAIAVLDPAGRVEVSTAAARDVFGLRADARLSDLPLPWLAPVFDEALRTGRPARGEGGAIQHFAGNEERFWQPRAVPILDGDKVPAGVVLVIDDVTRQREQDELKRGVISTVSHQFKTPLTSVRMAVHLLLAEKIGALTEKQVEVLLAARDDADRLNDILDDLLDLSRIESGRAPLTFRAVPPFLLAMSAAEPFRAAARDRGVALDVAVPEGLPEAWVDPSRIANVFDNLLTNALRHTPAGGTVSLSADADEGHVRFRVSDTGTGIPGGYLDRIFEPFFRVPGQAARTGVGLGLSIVREIVEAHGGTVRVESREGEGSAFHFILRRADRVAREESAP